QPEITRPVNNPGYWDDLVGKAASYPALFYRWFGGFPPGFGEVEASFGSPGSFKNFLSGRNLSYFGPAAYAADIGAVGPDPIAAALDRLITGPGRALVISGPGGVGKTRTAIEICLAASERGWWPVRLDRFASADGIAMLCRSHASSAKLLLFIDYAESFRALDTLPEAVFRLAQDGGHQISIVASTRNRAAQPVVDQLYGMETDVISTGGHEHAPGYRHWVVARILAEARIPEADNVAASCAGLPVMAAFAVFLYREAPDRFAEQFGNLVAVKDFSSWVGQRLMSVEQRFASEPVQQVLADLAMRLPMSNAGASIFRSRSNLHNRLFEVLLADRWIDVDQEGVSAAHDVLADAMLARHLMAMPGCEQDRLHELLALALDEDRIFTALAALDRLAGHAVFARLSGQAAVDRLMLHRYDLLLSSFPLFVTSRLLPPSELIPLLAGSPPLRNRLFGVSQAYLAIARAAEWAGKKGSNIVDHDLAEAALADILPSIVDNLRSSIGLRCAHDFQPEIYRSRVTQRLVAEPHLLESHHLIVSLLNGGMPASDVRSYLDAWLASESNISESQASFVYEAWLSAGGGTEAVARHVADWLGQHGTALEATFVYKAWLAAGGSWSHVSQACEAWLARNWRRPEAVFLTKSLSQRADISRATAARIVGWAALHRDHEDAIFRLSRASRWFVGPNLTARARRLIIHAVQRVLPAILAKPAISNAERDACSYLFGHIARWTQRDGDWDVLVALFCAGLRDGRIFHFARGMPPRAWAILLYEAVKLGKLDPVAEPVANAHAHQLVRQSVGPTSYAALVARGAFGSTIPALQDV
ncbi:ATP-binding protein, partial [Sandarakinorhabdus cyanobacteriorum]|uniref:ATP-binding protein n=1 Tax=Sandarakinorhabdus cyanobacteriorum TaxID=1981098 RepID=UPI0013FD21C4